jgi:hypothetical protein
MTTPEAAFVAVLREEMDRAWDAAVQGEAKQMAMWAGCTWCPSAEDVARWLPVARRQLERVAGLQDGELDDYGA